MRGQDGKHRRAANDEAIAALSNSEAQASQVGLPAPRHEWHRPVTAAQGQPPGPGELPDRRNREGGGTNDLYRQEAGADDRQHCN